MPGPRTLAKRVRVLDLDQANALISQARLIARRMSRRAALMLRLEAEIDVLRAACEGASRHNPDLQELIEKSVRFHRLSGQIDALVERLAELGCEVRNRDTTHLDFRFLRDDGLAFFCCGPDDHAIDCWHHMHESHSQRRPLPNTAPPA